MEHLELAAHHGNQKLPSLCVTVECKQLELGRVEFFADERACALACRHARHRDASEVLLHSMRGFEQ